VHGFGAALVGTRAPLLILALSGDWATGEAYCLAHLVTVEGDKRRLMVTSLRYLDTLVAVSGKRPHTHPLPGGSSTPDLPIGSAFSPPIARQCCSRSMPSTSYRATKIPARTPPTISRSSKCK
jgi:hypothetical protein